MERSLDWHIYMLCPVRHATSKEKRFLKKYKKKWTSKGFRVQYPAEDTNQDDPTGGYRICDDHTNQIYNSMEIHSRWNPTSVGSHVDLGTGLSEHFARGQNIKLINREEVEDIVSKRGESGPRPDYEELILVLDNLAREEMGRQDTNRTYWAYKDICEKRSGEKKSYIHWTPGSKRSHLELGILFPNHFVHGRNIKLINRDDVEEEKERHEAEGRFKTYEHVLLILDDKARRGQH